MQMIAEALAKVRHQELLKAAAADRFASIARRASRARRAQRLSVLDELGAVPLFQGMRRRDLAVLARYADPFTARSGTLLARESAPRAQFVVVSRGIAEASREGRRVGLLAAGDHFGELTLLDAPPQVPTVRAVTAVHGFAFGRRGFWDAVNEIPVLAVRLATRLAEDLASARVAAPDVAMV